MYSLFPLLAFSLSVFLAKAQLYFGFPPNAGCPQEEAFWHDGYYYQFYDCPMTWNDAEQTCTSSMIVDGDTVFGGHLISILNRVERDWLQFQIRQRYGRHVGIWIGLKRAPRDRESCPVPRRWTDGNRVLYTNFDQSEPDCRWDYQDCFHMTRNQTWNDAECSSPMRFICKIPAPDDVRPIHSPDDFGHVIVPDDSQTDSPIESSTTESTTVESSTTESSTTESSTTESSTVESTRPSDQEATTTPLDVTPEQPIPSESPETPPQPESPTPSEATTEPPRDEISTGRTMPPHDIEPAQPVPSGDLPPPPPPSGDEQPPPPPGK